MFENAFSFDGRIRRTEYGISVIIYAVIAVIINLIAEANRDASFVFIVYIPALWFLLAQASKRCHDVGNSGWWQLIPLYGFWLLFQEGELGQNQYGNNPKGNQQNTNSYNSTNIGQQQPTNSSGGYNQGNNNYYSNKQTKPNYNKKNSSGEYNSGELYK
mgnify:CR=1 FL=1